MCTMCREKTRRKISKSDKETDALNLGLCTEKIVAELVRDARNVTTCEFWIHCET